MNTLLFKYAIEIERTGSITQAAENLFMAQPNLSKAIKEAEDTLGYEIFERTSKGVIPTKKGRRFLDCAREIVLQLNGIENISDNTNDNVKRLRAALPHACYISGAALKLLSALESSEKNGIEFDIIETSAMKTIEYLVNSRFNIGIIRYQTAYEQYFRDYLEEKNLCGETVWEYKNVLLVSEKSGISSKETVYPEDIAGMTEILSGDSMVPYINAEKDSGVFKVCAPGKNAENRQICLYDRASQLEMLASEPDAYMFTSPMPAKTLEIYRLSQRNYQSNDNNYKDLLVYRKKYAFSDVEKKFIDKIYEAKNEISFRAE